MSSCRGEGSTHWHACDCREAYVARLERVVEAARGVTGGTAELVMRMGNDREVALWDALHRAVAALDEAPYE
jgi:hypothetical protein